MSEGLIRAAGGIVVRTDPDGTRRLVLVHRPRYDDWTFPKGKLQPGEADEDTAIREVEEETGLRCKLLRDIGSVRYRDPEDRPKIVRYWLMEPDEGAFTPTEEVDELRWLEVEDAMSQLTYEHDRELLRSLESGDGAVYLVRHGRAGARDKWRGEDELRPLSKAGRRQAEALARAFRGVELERVISSPYVRCVQTVRPLALDHGLPVETSAALVEGASLEEALVLIADVADTRTVLCSHGDVIPAVVLHLADRGTALLGDRDWKKGSTWALERKDGHFSSATYWPPPEEG